MTNEQIFLDVNVPMYAAGADHPNKEACQWLMELVASEKLPVVIDTEIIQEILYRYGAQHRFDIAEKMAGLVLSIIPTVLSVDVSDAELSIQLFSEYAREGVKLRDLLHTAVMKNNGIEKIISTDRHFDQIDGITRLDPFTLFKNSRNN